jgi:serine-type D-Ala-D-Ala carboxypeptidase (penicillin-binding protein 5/6)
VGSGEPARHERRRTTVYRTGGRRTLLGAVAVLLLVSVALAAAGSAQDGATRTLTLGARPARGGPAWPQQGQAAVAVGARRPAASPSQRPAPIASLAKLMTAYLTLERFPLRGEEEGFTVAVGPAEAQAEAAEAAQGQSVVPVRPGEQLSERQLLEALLIPSGNNIARTLAAVVAGSQTGFIADMNAEARELGLVSTTYTDPSGFDPSTVSTAADQLRVLQRAMRFEVFRQIVSMSAVTLPVAGTLTNFNPLIGQGFAGKTGSDSAAGGCLAFFTHLTRGGRPETVAGVVMGQGEGSDTRAILDAAGEAAQQLVASVASSGGAAGTVAP